VDSFGGVNRVSWYQILHDAFSSFIGQNTTIAAASLKLANNILPTLEIRVTESVDTPSSMCWVRDPAGAGIAQPCAEKLKETVHFGAAFFSTINNSLHLFTSIAHQLATALPDYRAAVDERISKVLLSINSISIYR